MTETVDLNVKVDAFAKRKAEAVLDELGISMSNAIDMFLYKVALDKDISFRKELPPAPPSLNMDLMTAEEIHEILKKSVEECKVGNYASVDEVFKDFR